MIEEEFSGHLCLVTRGPYKGKNCQEMIDEADRDGDGEVNEEEFLRIMKKLSSNSYPQGDRVTLARPCGKMCV